jgi:hypothetical protein
MQDLDKKLTDLGITGIHAELRDGSWTGCASITRTIWMPPIGDKSSVLQTFAEFLEAVVRAAEEMKQ